MVDKPSDDRRPRGSLRRLVEVFVLCSFAIGQPLLDVSGQSPETFLFHHVQGLEVLGYALIILVVPPMALWLAVSGITLLRPWWGRITYLLVAGGLIALTAVQAGKNLTGLRGPALVAISLLIAAAVLWVIARSMAAQTFVTYLTPAPLVFALLFVIASPTGELVRPAAGASGGESQGSGPSPPVVVLFFDELPTTSLLDSSGQVDGRVFPNFAALARTSHWFRNGTGVGPFTAYAVPSMLTGRYPREKLVPSHAQHPDNLFSLLASDYRIRAFETITQLCDPAICAETAPAGDGRGLGGLLAQTWKVTIELAKPYEDDSPISDQFTEVAAGPVRRTSDLRGATITEPNWKSLKANQPERFRQFMAGLRPGPVPTLHFLHLLLPHNPWRYLPSGATYPDRVLGGAKGGWGPESWPVQVNRQAHLLQLAYTDRLLGDTIDRLRKQGIWDDALVVVTSDHGESFIAGRPNRRIGGADAEAQAQVAWVPVFIKEPGQSQGTVSDANWEHVDLLPTMADILDRKARFRMDGVSQLSSARERTTKYFYNYPGRRITFPGPPAFRIVLGGVTDTLVRGSQGQAGLYAMGSRPEWIGKPTSGLTPLGVTMGSTPSELRARLSEDVDLHAVDPAGGTVPSLVTGTLQGASGNGGFVVIVVNGIVGAVSEIYPHGGEPTFAGLVNDALFKPGTNDLTLYEVVGELDPELRRIAVS